MGLRYPPTIKRPNIYLPDGWDAGWRTAKAAAGSDPAWITCYGDSISAGSYLADPFGTNYFSKIRAALCPSNAGLYADYYSCQCSQGAGSSPWSAITGSLTNATDTSNGWHQTYHRSGGSSTTFQTFTLPYAVTSLDIVYGEFTNSGTWNFTISGSGSFNWSVNGVAQPAGTLGSASTVTVTVGLQQVKRVTISTALPAGTTITIGNDTNAGVLYLFGVSCYRAANGLGFANFSTGGFFASYYTSSPRGIDVPFGHVLLQGGGVPNVGGPQPPAPTSVSAVYTPQVASGGAGNVDAGTRNYMCTWTGPGGESGASNTSASYVQAGATTVNITMQNPPGASSTDGYKGFCHCTINYYTTKAANNGLGAPGTTNNPWYLAGNATGTAAGTATFVHNVADSSLSTQYGGGSAPVSWGAWGFPLSPHLAVIALGVNDCAAAQAAPTSTTQIYSQLIQAIRRGNPNASVLLVGVCYPAWLTSDAWPSQPICDDNGVWYSYLDYMREMARIHNCAFVNIHDRWGQTPLANGFIGTNGVHPTLAGHADMASVLCSVI